jgi:DNA-nicking Smr family endonuclease
MAATDKRRRLVSDADARLWEALTREVKPLTGRELPPQAAPKKHEPAAAPKPKPPPPSSPLPRVPVPLPTAAKATAPGIDKASATRLKRGQMAIDARLDLHGMTQDEAHRVLEAFVASRYAADRRNLLIITGKGFNPAAREPDAAAGVLRRMVPRWLNELPTRRKVLTWHAAQPKDGGDGALYVLLRKRRPEGDE